MTEFRGIKVVAVAERYPWSCDGCIADSDPDELVLCALCGAADEDGPQSTFQPASLHDGRPHVVLTGGRKPNFPIGRVFFRDGITSIFEGEEALRLIPRWEHIGADSDIIAVERADNLKGEEKWANKAQRCHQI